MIRFTVIGTPAPQGSKTAWGTEANPNTRPWRATVAAAAAEAMTTTGTFKGSLTPEMKPLLRGPLELQVTFIFPRPKSHYRTGRNADVLKPSAPVYAAGRPDADKLLRAIGDALTGVVVLDDALFVRVSAVKLYGAPARAEITVREVSIEQEDAA